MTTALPATQVVAWSGPSMGGLLDVAVAVEGSDAVGTAEAQRSVARVGRRVNAWADRLTRFADTSDLMRLNRDTALVSSVRPTLAAVLGWAGKAGKRSGHALDITLLDARLAAERGPSEGEAVAAVSAGVSAEAAGPATWRLEQPRRGRRSALMHRAPGTHFDLDGVAKGWLADRALGLLARWPSACVDADGDIAMSVAPGADWQVQVKDPRDGAVAPLVVLRVASSGAWRLQVGIATSGTSVHRWTSARSTPQGRATSSVGVTRQDDVAPPAGRNPPAHHLIDPRTGRPAITDVVQATVVAPSAAEAEVLAKSAVILGSIEGARLLERSACFLGLLLLETGETIRVPAADGPPQ